MSHGHDEGASPFERLTTHMDDVDLVCPDCGYEDEDGSWSAKTNGDTVLYCHVCPSCGSIRKRTFELGEE